MLMLCREAKREDFLKNYEQEDYIFEIKFDGERALFYIEDFKITKIINRRGYDILKQFIEFKELLFNIKSGVIDSEIIVENGNEGGDFNNGLAFRNHLKNEEKIKERSKRLRAKIMAFDILFKEGEDLRYKPLLKRKEALKTAFNDNDLIEYVKYSVDFKQLWDYVISKDIEGVIAKHKAVAYEDTRSKYWIKIKRKIQRFIKFNQYTINNKGVRITNGFDSIQVQGNQSKEIIEKIKQNDFVICEVECMSINKSGKLRMPVFKKCIS